MKRKITAWLAAAAMSVTMLGTAVPGAVQTVSAAGGYQMEYLDRGISAVNTGSGMLVSWRYLASDSENTEFRLYRGTTLVYTSGKEDATCYLDTGGKSSDTYRVETVENGTVTSTSTCALTSDQSYFQLNLDPPTSSDCTYSPNDCSTGDADGDGVYEIFLKWDPSNSKDNSQKGVTGNVYIDCYRLDGTRLWRIDLGKNIRAGAHYTQFFVADYDCDGKAEMTCKTADGTVDGLGNVIGDASKDYRNSSGYVLSGPEYYTLFDGLTGAALDTVDYEPERGTVSKWGDRYGNRVDRFWGSVAYLDGVHPSVVTGRGYYTRMTATAYDVVNKKLVKRWAFDTGNSSSAAGYGDGNHNSMAADVDGDGKQEILTGATCIDDNGSVLWCLNTGHGDAMHLGDLLPERNGLELWICHEDKPYGVSLIDAATGKTIFHKDGSGDTGRCCADNVWAGNNGAEFWGLGNDVFDGSGNTLSCRRPAINFLSYWDGDLEREILDGYTDSPATISKMGADGKLTTLLSTDGYYTCNTTKGTPCLSADLFGDWREELIVRGADSKSIRIYCTTYDTDYRIQTLMHDPQYRVQVSAQQTAYNQPPHASFYLGSDQALPEYISVTVPEKGVTDPIPPTPTKPTAAALTDGAVYMLKNVNSGLYLEVADGAAQPGANVQQWGADASAAHNTWRAVSAGGGYYYLYSQLGDKVTYLLDVAGGKADNATNIAIWSKSTREQAQQFLFSLNDDGSYTIYTKASDLGSCVEIVNAETGNGGNVQQYEVNGHPCQHWMLEQVTDSGAVMDTTQIYQMQNANSQLYLEVQDGKAEAGANVQQWGADGAAKHNTWTLESAGDGYYYIYSQLGDGKTYYLDIARAKDTDGTNVEIYTESKTAAQQFKFVKNPDGTYHILTKVSGDKSGLGIEGASTANGGNVVQWTLNGSADQKWILTSAGTIEQPQETTEPPVVTTEPPVTTETETTTSTSESEDTQSQTTSTSTTSTEPPVLTTTQAPETETTASSETTVVSTTSATPSDTDPIGTTATTKTTTTTTTKTTVATEATTKTLTPATTTTTVSEEMSVLFGDVNLDGRVDITDAVLMNKAVAGAVKLGNQAFANADCLQDGELSGDDAISLLQFLVHLIDSLPVKG
ncbi:RICIN domain-containing protein [uncultured Ruminococcus sp.]|uniref:rhamnogalacturonan lyase family protein n=1 Tax=uncultured Ruminococcus sp. TaxID=165186 RepID=UPI0026222617|nr:RICIN domain-containing protein [uncultured Ruminococcus sp.]